MTGGYFYATFHAIFKIQGDRNYVRNHYIHHPSHHPRRPCSSYSRRSNLLPGSRSSHRGFLPYPDHDISGELFAAVHEGKIIGFINGCVTDEKTIRDEMYEDSALHKPNGRYQSIFGLDVMPEYRRQGIAAALMNHMIEDARKKGRSGLILTCKERLIHYYEKFGYKNLGVSASVHGGAVWYDMLLEFGEE